MKCLAVILVSVALANGYSIKDNEVETARLYTSDDLLDSVISDCFGADSSTSCLKVKVLSFLDTKLGVTAESARALEEKNIDKVIFERVGRILNENEFRFQLPEFLFQSAEVSYRADRGFDVDFPKAETENGEGKHKPKLKEKFHLFKILFMVNFLSARGILKKKLLLPVLLLLKLKMKALMPILVAIIGIKAVKALVLSKLAITLVLGFLIYNLLMKKGGMPMMMPTEAAPPAPQYGPPASQYGPPSTPAAPADTYGPQWEPSSSGPYARVWDPSQLAYSSYFPGDSNTSAASNQSPNVRPHIKGSHMVGVPHMVQGCPLMLFCRVRVNVNPKILGLPYYNIVLYSSKPSFDDLIVVCDTHVLQPL
ncbi:unnamed protein product [Chilo suppressalis]|uniref:Osiris 20 n=1 Tax=Chilo suppressalis TaxID=168631 RepID=A0ABN8B665_CHISP|nr:unnamed protein product [Chilo suppressalis]